MKYDQSNFVKTASSYDFFRFDSPGVVFTGIYLDSIEMEIDGKAEPVLLFLNADTDEEIVLSPYHQIMAALEAVHTIGDKEYNTEEHKESLLFQFVMKEKTKTKKGQQFTKFECYVALIAEDDEPEKGK